MLLRVHDELVFEVPDDEVPLAVDAPDNRKERINPRRRPTS